MLCDNFLVTGAQRNMSEFDESHLSTAFNATLYLINFKTKEIIKSLILDKPDDNIYNDEYSFSFRGGHLSDSTFYTCTHSEVVAIDTNAFKIKYTLTDKSFNDLHHVAIIKNKLYAVSTGIDCIVEIEDQNVNKIIPVLPESYLDNNDFNDIDFRKISTKPHNSHPNHVFELGGALWATRFVQRDAVRLPLLDERIDISVEKPHDGVLVNNEIYFTTVDGKIIVIDRDDLSIKTIHDISSYYRHPPGWCRGVSIVKPFAYVGFSSFRRTKISKNISFLKKGYMGLKNKFTDTNQTSRIVKFDLEQKKIIDEFVFHDNRMNIIFSIIPMHNIIE